MQPIRILFLLAAVLLTQSVVAQGLPRLFQEQLDALEARTQVLEENAPDSSVEGRTYCFVLTQLLMQGPPTLSSDRHLQSQVIRRTATFSGGFFEALFLSRVRNFQDNTGAVTQQSSAGNTTFGTYTQTGNKLDIVLPGFGISATWYVSNDGSLIYGSLIELSGPFGQANDQFVGITRNWTLVENDTCDVEGQ